MWLTGRSNFQGGLEKPICRERLPKKGLGQFVALRGLGKKEGRDVSEGGLIPQCPLCLCFRLALLPSVSYFFFLYRSPSLSFCTVFDSISSNIDEVLSINSSANVFVFGDYNVHHKD